MEFQDIADRKPTVEWPTAALAALIYGLWGFATYDWRALPWPALVALGGVCGMPLQLYVWAFVYAGTALALVRSFAEHRAETQVERRTAIVEDSWLLGPLFLFNNLHVVHHLRPSLPWWKIPRWYRLNRAAVIARNGGLVYRSYFEVARLYLFKPHDAAVHPSERAAAAAERLVPAE